MLDKDALENRNETDGGTANPMGRDQNATPIKQPNNILEQC